MSQYDYTKYPVAIDSLAQQINTSAIVTALDHITTYGSSLSILFKTDLSGGDKTVLDAIVANHDGKPLPDMFVNQTQTRFERSDIDLKLARGKAEVVAGTPNQAIAYIKSPGDFGSGLSRWASGGYALVQYYDPDDYVSVYVEDKDRNIAWALAMGNDPNAQAPMSDADVVALGILPQPFGQAFPQYPILKSYTDDELDVSQQGWHFWPLAQGNGLLPYGETDIETIGFYGNIPAGLYIKMVLTRPNVSTGTLRVDVFWGKSE